MKKLLLLASLFIFLICDIANALEYYPSFGPLATRTQNPLYLLFFSLTPESPNTIEPGKFQWTIKEVFTSMNERNFKTGALGVDLDMEVYRTSLDFSYSFYKSFEVGAELPFLSFSGGFLDSFVQSYHHTFGFPNGGRELVPNGRFSYKITRGAQNLYSVTQETFGLSDINFYLKHQFLEEKGKVPALSLKGAFKVPTGNRESGLGSGSVDFHLNLALEKSYKRFHSYTNMGYLGLGNFPPLEGYTRSAVFAFSQSFELNITHIASVVGQVQTNTPLFAYTRNPLLDKPPVDLNVGFKGTGPKNSQWKHFLWEFVFTEDLAVNGPSPDFSVYFRLGANLF